jgi:methylase of polypeptide subunit release factors
MRNARDLKLENRLTLLNAILNTDGIIEVKKEYFLKQPVNILTDKFDIIVCNPPYIATKALFNLQPEIKL